MRRYFQAVSKNDVATFDVRMLARKKNYVTDKQIS